MAPPFPQKPKPPGTPIPGLGKPPSKPLGNTFQKQAPKQATGESGLEFNSTLSGFRSLNATMGRGIILAGKPGIGKSSLMSHLPGVLFICDPLETGILDLIDNGRVSITRDQVMVAPDWPSLKLILGELIATPNNVQSIVLESYGAIELMIMNYVCEDRWKGDFTSSGFFNFQNGPKSCGAKDVPELVRLLQKLRMRGVHICMTAHTHVKMQKNVDGVGFEAEVVAAQSQEMWPVMERWAESVIFMIYQQELEKIGDGKTKARAIVPSFVCHRTGVYPCKNKWGINHYINLDGKDSRECYEALCDAAKIDPATFRNK